MTYYLGDDDDTRFSTARDAALCEQAARDGAAKANSPTRDLFECPNCHKRYCAGCANLTPAESEEYYRLQRAEFLSPEQSARYIELAGRVGK